MSLSALRAGYPIIAAALEERMEKRATAKPMANRVARKADLRAVPVARPVAVLGGYISPDEDPRARQWLTDLTGMSRISFAAQSSAPVYLFYFDEGGEELSPAFVPLLDSDGQRVSADVSSGGPDWLSLPAERRTTLRLTVSTSASSLALNPNALDGPFALSLEARG